MKKLLIATLAVFALVLVVAPAYAKSDKANSRNGQTYIHFGQGSYDCHTYWVETGNGMLHEWRDDCAPYAGVTDLHLQFKPYSKFMTANCDSYGYLGSTLWTANPGTYTEYSDDEADLDDLFTTGDKYWVCFYDMSP